MAKLRFLLIVLLLGVVVMLFKNFYKYDVDRPSLENVESFIKDLKSNSDFNPRYNKSIDRIRNTYNQILENHNVIRINNLKHNHDTYFLALKDAINEFNNATANEYKDEDVLRKLTDFANNVVYNKLVTDYLWNSSYFSCNPARHIITSDICKRNIKKFKFDDNIIVSTSVKELEESMKYGNNLKILILILIILILFVQYKISSKEDKLREIEEEKNRVANLPKCKNCNSALDPVTQTYTSELKETINSEPFAEHSEYEFYKIYYNLTKIYTICCNNCNHCFEQEEIQNNIYIETRAQCENCKSFDTKYSEIQSPDKKYFTVSCYCNSCKHEWQSKEKEDALQIQYEENLRREEERKRQEQKRVEEASREASNHKTKKGWVMDIVLYYNNGKPAVRMDKYEIRNTSISHSQVRGLLNTQFSGNDIKNIAISNLKEIYE